MKGIRDEIKDSRKDYREFGLRWQHSVRREKALIIGVALGLFYGIIGNLIISHYYAVFERLIIGKLDYVFRMNLLILASTLIIIIMLSKKWHNRLEFIKAETLI